MRVLVYARASTKRQKEKQLSVPAQIRAIRGFAQQKQWEIVDVFEDAPDDVFCAQVIGLGFVGDRHAMAQHIHADALDVLRDDVVAPGKQGMGTRGLGEVDAGTG